MNNQLKSLIRSMAELKALSERGDRRYDHDLSVAVESLEEDMWAYVSSHIDIDEEIEELENMFADWGAA